MDEIISTIREFDSPWKEVLERFLEAVLQLFFPDLHAVIDWSKGYESLDTELQAITREAELGKVLADKLFRVHLLDGTDSWILIHLEVQSQPDADFARRMFVYHYRILDCYNRDVASLAILGDESANWRPSEYEKIGFGCEVRFRFRHVKLLDWTHRADELAASSNLIAPIVLAHLQSLATHRNPKERLHSKWQLIRGLYERGLNAEIVRELYRCIDWFLELPIEMERELRTRVRAYLEEHRMPYVTSFERLAKDEGRDEGRRDGILESVTRALEVKFEGEGLAFSNELRDIEDLNVLFGIQKAILIGKSLDELRNLLPQRQIEFPLSTIRTFH